MRIFRILIQCRAPLHCGGPGNDPLYDKPVARDAFGVWRIPASSLAGSLRALAAAANPQMAENLFGGGDDSNPSKIWCEDGLLQDFDGQSCLNKKLRGQSLAMDLSPIIRDHVRLNLESGCGVEGGKFDCEIVPAGARFLLEFRCDGWNRPLTEEENAFFDQLCAVAANGAIDLGGGLTNGYGRYDSLEQSLREFDLADPASHAAWLNLEGGRMFLPGEGVEIPLPKPWRAEPDGRLHGSLGVDLESQGPILVAGGSPVGPDGTVCDADMVFARSPFLDYAAGKTVWRYVLPSTSVKGVLRHDIYAILRDRGLFHSQAEKIINRLFGYAKDGDARPGRLIVEDCLLEGGSPELVQHVALDRMSCSSLAGALFNEAPLWSGKIRGALRLHPLNLEAHEAALLFHALLDIFSGQLNFGNGGNRGNGRLHLPAWRDNLSAVTGDLHWNGQAILPLSPQKLQDLAGEWDEALNQTISTQEAS